MCELIAKAFARQLDARFPNLSASEADRQLEQDVCHFYQPLDPYVAREISMVYSGGGRQDGTAATRCKRHGNEASKTATSRRPCRPSLGRTPAPALHISPKTI